MMAARVITDITLLCVAKGTRFFHWEEPVKHADLQALRHTTHELAALPPSMDLRERMASYNRRNHGLTALPEASPRDKQTLRCVSGMHHEPSRGGNEPIRMRTGLQVVAAGIHDLRRLPQDGSHIGELPEELRFVQLIVPSVIGRAHLKGRSKVSMLELGAGWAYYSLLFASMTRSAGLAPTNVMVEPLRRNLKAGQMNFARNGFCPPESNATEATWTRGMICDAPEQRATGRYSKSHQSLAAEGGCVSVSGLMVARGLSRLDVLWADLQGAEVEALRGAPLDRIDHVHIGTHGRKMHNTTLHLLRSSGFLIEYHLPPHDPYFATNDGYIHAVR